MVNAHGKKGDAMVRRKSFLPFRSQIKRALLKEENEYGIANAERLKQFTDNLIEKANDKPPKNRFSA